MQYSNETWRDHIFPLMDGFSLHHTECIFPSDERGTKAFHFNIRKKDKIVTLQELESFYGRENDVDQLQNLLYTVIRGFYPEDLEGCFSEYTRILWAEAPIGRMSFSAYLICFPPIQDEKAIWNDLEQAVLGWMKIFLMPAPVKKQRKHPKKSNRQETKETPPEESVPQETKETPPEESDEQETKETPPEESVPQETKETPPEESDEQETKETPPEESVPQETKETPPEESDEQETKETPSEESAPQETKENPPEESDEQETKETPPENSNQPEKKETLVEEPSHTDSSRYQKAKVYRWGAFVLPWCALLMGLRREWRPVILIIIFCAAFLLPYGISLYLKYAGR